MVPHLTYPLSLFTRARWYKSARSVFI